MTRHKKFHRLLATVLSLILMISMMPTMVFAVQTITYLDENGDSVELTESYVLIDDTNISDTWTNGWYVVDGNVTINSRVTVNDDVKLVLKDNASLTVNGGISVPSGSAFTVYGQQNGTGNLTSIGKEGNAGIGGTRSDVNFGTIILAANGNIIAQGDTRAAGIGGGGLMSNNQSVNGRIHIYRGTIEATGGGWAAGIGGGADSVTDCNIIIDGGTIIAQGGINNVGIGGTDGSKTITINGGNIKAYGSGYGAGIGGSYNASGGSITITGGVIQASSIGGGSADGGGPGGAIVISGGVVTTDRIGAGGNNEEGTSFTTTSSGNAVIFAGSITDQNGKNNWNGVIFEGSTGSVYGGTVTVTENFEIPQDYELTVNSGQTLVIDNSVQLTNKGTIKNNGTIENNGIILNDGGQIIQNPVTGNSPVTPVLYLDENNTQQTLKENYTVINSESSATEWTNSWYVVGGNVTIDSRVTVTGDVRLILKDGALLTVNGGIDVSSGNSFTVYAQSTGENMGGLTATGGENQAGIGGSNSQTVGTIIVNGGTVTANGGRYAMGLGGNVTGAGGTITINGGNVTAKGGDGYSFGWTNRPGGVGIAVGQSGTVTINNGNVSATGGNGSHDIFTAAGGVGIKTGVDGETRITGGFVNAQPGSWESIGIAGTFSTGSNGNGVIITQNFEDTSNSQDWNGLFFIENAVGVLDKGSIYGQTVTPTCGFTVPSGVTLTIEKEQSLVISQGITMKNDGTIINSGIIDNQGTIDNSGSIQIESGGIYDGNQPNTNSITCQINWDTDGDGDVDDTTYVAYGGTPTHEKGSKEADAQYTYIFTKWWPELAVVTEPTTYKAQFSSSINQYTVTLLSGEGYTVTANGSTTVDYDTEFTFTVNIEDGYSMTDEFAVKANNDTELTKETDGSYKFIVKGDTNITVEGVADITAPEGDIKIKENSIKKFINEITFGLFFKENIDVTITAEDRGSGVASTQYYRSTEILTEEQVKAIADWKDYSSISETAEDAKKFIYYVKITDNAGNVTYFGSVGVTFDLTAPVIAGITDKGEYYTTQSVTVSDVNLESITINGEQKSGTTFTLEGNVEKSYTIVATDKAGNVTTYKVTMKPIESIAASIKDLTVDNVTSENKEGIEAVKEAVKAVNTENATEEEKTALKAIADNCTVLLDKIGEISDEIAELTASVGALDVDTITSNEKGMVNDLLVRAEELLASGNLTDKEISVIQSVQQKANELKEKLEESSQAGTTENIDKVENINTDNVTMENKDDLTAAKEDLENALGNFGGNYTEEEKAQLQNKLDQINDALESIEKVENIITSLPETVEPDDTENEALINEAKKQYEALTDHEKSLIPEEWKLKLESLLSDLVDYQIIAGNGSKWTLGDNGSISMIANGSLEKFIGIKVDGKTVDAANYTMKSGSTIITLKSTYLDTLSVGKHTLTVIYSDGQTSGEFEILKKSDTITPETGDNSNADIWFALMLVATCGLIGMTIYNRRKKYSK